MRAFLTVLALLFAAPFFGHLAWIVYAIATIYVVGKIVLRIMNWHESRRRKTVLSQAIDLWNKEFDERMEIELARGVTDTMAQKLVWDVMERYWPETYDFAVLFLKSRGAFENGAITATHDHPANTIQIIPPAGRRQEGYLIR